MGGAQVLQGLFGEHLSAAWTWAKDADAFSDQTMGPSCSGMPGAAIVSLVDE